MYRVRVTYKSFVGLGERSYIMYTTDNKEDAYNKAKELEKLAHIQCVIISK